MAFFEFVCRFQAHADVFWSVEWIIRIAISCSEAEVAESPLPYTLFHEACDWGSSEEKEQIAEMFVNLKDKWKSPKFATPGCKNMLLRLSTGILSLVFCLIPAPTAVYLQNCFRTSREHLLQKREVVYFVTSVRESPWPTKALQIFSANSTLVNQ